MQVTSVTGSADFPHTLLDTIDEIVYSLDLRGDAGRTGGRVTFVSHRVRDVLGYDPEDFLADPSLWFSLLHPADRASVEASSRQILESGLTGRRNYRLRHRTRGVWLWFEDSVVPQFDEAGALIGCVGAARDVTARRRVTQQMAVLLENSRDGFFTLDESGRCTYVNPAGARMLDRAPAQIVGEHLHLLLTEPERSVFQANHSRAVMEGNVVRSTGFCSSLHRWLEVAYFPSPDGAMVNFRDITAQRTSEERLRTWVDDAPVALFRTIPFGKLLDANGTALAMLRYPNLETFREQTSLDLVVEPSDGSAPRMNLDAFERLSGVPITLRRFDGSHMPVLMNLHTVRDHAGTVIEVLGSFEDRTDPAALRTALLSSGRRYRILFDENVTPLIVVGMDGALVSQNKAFRRLVGSAPGTEEVTRTLDELLATPGAVADLLGRMRGEERIEGLDLTLRRADGGKGRVLASARVSSELPGSQLVEIAFVDIEDRCQAEDQLRRTLQEREFLMRELHHRVKNNLQLISSLLSLQTHESDDERLREFAQKTRDRIMAMAVVHERLYQADTVGASCILGYLETLARHLGKSHDATERGIALAVRGACVDLPLDLTMRCGLVVNELVMNALKHAFGADGGVVDVRVERPDIGTLVIEVADSGRGLPSSFEPAGATTLGVQMVVNLVARSGGMVQWTTGPGTTVRVTLPLAAPDPDGSFESQGAADVRGENAHGSA